MKEPEKASDDYFSLLKDWSIQARAKLGEHDLTAVSRLMYLIRSTSLTFGCFQCAHIASLVEHVVEYASAHQEPKSLLRKCYDSIWDALTTFEYMVTNGMDETTDEQKIVIFRLGSTLKSFQDFTPPLTQSEIDVVVRHHQKLRDIARQRS